ncbi:MAG: nuclear transport factor 2 family protein [Pseudomonadota bacterium]|nr:nuclear transport factor 2 family protein [Pseudomonadota bacterium]
MTSKDLTADESATRQALHNLLVTYARGADRGDEAIMRSAFHPDARMETGLADAAIDRYVPAMVGRTRADFRTVFHSISNERVAIDGDRARGECYVFAYALTNGNAPLELMAGGRYLDRFERRGGCWLIAHRLYVQDWKTTRSVDTPPPEMGSPTGPVRGGFFPDDPALGFWSND